MLALASSAVVVCSARYVSAGADVWIGTVGGNWMNGAKWSAGVQPAAGDDVFVTNSFSGSQTINYNYNGSPISFASLRIGNEGSGADTVQMVTSVLTVGGPEYVGYSGAGNFIQSLGTHSITGALGSLSLGQNVGSTGAYVLSGGLLSVDQGESIGVGGLGSFSQTGGANSALNIVLGLELTSSYAFSGGSISTGALLIGMTGNATFNQSGGTNTIASGGLTIGVYGASSGTYLLSAGLLAAGGDELVGDESNSGSRFVQAGGTNSFTGNLDLGVESGGIGSYLLSGGALAGPNAIVGHRGHGAVDQSGGVYSLTAGNLSIGYYAVATGTYSLSGGDIVSSSSSYQIVGDGGYGTFHQTGGTNTFQGISGLIIANSNTATGSYVLSGGLLSNQNYPQIIGSGGSGTFNQSGGTNVLNGVGVGSILLALNPGSLGTYNLAGGMLDAGSAFEIVGEESAGVFNQSGGTNSFKSGGQLLLGDSQSGTGSYTLSAGAIDAAGAVEIVGLGGPGTFNQSGGSNTVRSLTIANYSSYNLIDGTLSANIERLSNYLTGYFNQSGGTNTVSGAASSLLIAPGLNSTGTYTLSGGVLNIMGKLCVGGTTNTGGGIGSLVVSAGQLTTASLTNWNTGSILMSGGATISSGTYNRNLIIQTGGTANLGALTGTGSLSIGSASGPLAAMTLSSLQQSSVLIDASGTLTLNGGSTANTVSTLEIKPLGAMVINGSHSLLTLKYDGALTPNVAIRKYLQNGYNGGHWDGGFVVDGGFGSIQSADAASSGNALSMGYADGVDGVAVSPSNSGQLLPAFREEIKLTYAGDANLDGQVNLSDLIILANHFGSSGSQWDQGDYSYDGTVNLTDLIILANNFGDGVGSPAEQALVHSQFQQDLAQQEAANAAFAAAVGAAVPEPGGLMILSIGACGILSRKRRWPPSFLKKS